MKLRIKAILAGLATYVPGYDYLHATGGTDSARYCYSVWLRHLKLLHEAGALRGVPHTVAELGPGDSIGIGLAALLSGAERYYALDVVPYPDLKSNLAIFDELVRLFRERRADLGGTRVPGHAARARGLCLSPRDPRARTVSLRRLLPSVSPRSANRSVA